MDDEITAIERNNTWELVDLPSGQQIIRVKWIYKTKLKENGEIDKYKARLVAKGHKQKKAGFKKCPHEHTLYVKAEDGKIIIEFDMSDLGLMHYFLGIEVKQVAAGTFISQKKYAQEILDIFGMKNCNGSNTPSEVGMKLEKDPRGKKIDSTYYKQIVGSLMDLTATRPDIMYAVSLISRYMEQPKEVHLLAAKRILRYLQGTIDFNVLCKQ
ncbi:uncharacterized mitochondrial protein AtMg00810-like [Gossypium raimondii]|uniref:uncharacterized mitochondrial protein AtMg00810-like n=1 Tax=Gossypium raimondii TaxID=29730 RepID=UPI00227C4B6B|nr:uncharacterized mitochondrial protein AtMg00810-like [Gossypium raimondii]